MTSVRHGHVAPMIFGATSSLNLWMGRQV